MASSNENVPTASDTPDSTSLIAMTQHVNASALPSRPRPPVSAATYGSGASSRVRTFHNKSRMGCKTCKLRRIKCDEGRPSCQRCLKSGRECVREASGLLMPAGPSDAAVTGIRLVEPSNAIALDARSAVAIEHFLDKSVPILRQCRPSPLWDYMLQLCRDHEGGTVVRSIAAAIGQQQRAIEQQASLAGSSSVTFDEEAVNMYNSALRSLRKGIMNATSDPTAYVASCLLLIVLESLHGSHSNILLHLQYCIRIVCGQTRLTQASTAILQEAAIFLETFLVSTMNYDMYSEEATLSRQLFRELRTSTQVVDDVALIEQEIRADLLTALDRMSLGGSPSGSPPSDASSPREDDTHLADSVVLADRSNPFGRYEAAMEAAVETSILAAGPKSTAYYLFVQARSILSMIALRQVQDPSRPHLADLEDYTRVVDIEESALAELRQSNSDWSLEAASFSLGLGVISTLCHVAVRCKDFYLRRRALLVLETCPQREGVWTVARARQICRLVFRLEEQKVLERYGVPYQSGTELPEDCQIRVTTPREKDGRKYLCVIWKVSPGPGLSQRQDVPLE